LINLCIIFVAYRQNDLTQPKDMYSNADLIVKNNRIYHLNMGPEMLADTIVLVGDPERVAKVTKHFSNITHRTSKREFISATGYMGEKKMLVISTGIGTSNIDIVLHEINALLNIDFLHRKPKNNPRKLNIIRIGTSGSIQASVPAGSILVSESALGIDNLMHFYQCPNNLREQQMAESLSAVFDATIQPYCYEASQTLLEIARQKYPLGVTLTTPGFYGPQQRNLFQKNKFHHFIETMSNLTLPGSRKITNIEMETSAIYGLSKLFEHHALSFNLILAQREENTFLSEPEIAEENFIKEILDWIVQNV
jgi:uridine phosphorylase